MRKDVFSYYGSKSKIVDCYPKPKFDKIIEPFAGSARYSLKYYDRDIILVEKFHKVYKIWNYLQNASKQDILSLPDIGHKEKIPKSLSDAERWLIGYCVGRGSPRPATYGHGFNDWNSDKIRIANDLYKIKHWDIRFGDYSELENEQATWFIDPPYQKMGYKYNFSSNRLDFVSLASWCKERIGQVIVCENDGADWLPFRVMRNFSGANGKNVEAIWSNYPTAYDNEQQGLAI